ncbi:hypothetical protein BDZ88DRAFT_173555 [Geranomyces variabilis]|nr:hypothetical protein BDZ88DRAFT_173555 [Geranomyces variabilis]
MKCTATQFVFLGRPAARRHIFRYLQRTRKPKERRIYSCLAIATSQTVFPSRNPTRATCQVPKLKPSAGTQSISIYASGRLLPWVYSGNISNLNLTYSRHVSVRKTTERNLLPTPRWIELSKERLRRPFSKDRRERPPLAFLRPRRRGPCITEDSRRTNMRLKSRPGKVACKLSGRSIINQISSY